jgi:hypothetical protein
MESRALAEYARCSRAERLNLALRRNIPDASGLLAAKEKIQEKGPAEARPSLIRSGETGTARSPYRAIHVAARPDVAASVRSPKNFSRSAEKIGSQKYPPMWRHTCRIAATIGACNVYKNRYH